MEHLTLMPQYQSHKKVRALKIEQVTLLPANNPNETIAHVFFDNQAFDPIKVNLFGKPTPHRGWYYVVYEAVDDNQHYESFSPPAAFENGYTQVDQPTALDTLSAMLQELVKPLEDRGIWLFKWNKKVVFQHIGSTGWPSGESISFLWQNCGCGDNCAFNCQTINFLTDGAELHACGCRTSVIKFRPVIDHLKPEEVAAKFAGAVLSLNDAEPRKPEPKGIGWAIKQMQNGARVGRAGWNGKGMFLFLVPGSRFKVNRAPLLGIYPEGTEIDYRPHVDLKSVDGSVVPWQASQTDLLALDWEIVR